MNRSCYLAIGVLMTGLIALDGAGLVAQRGDGREEAAGKGDPLADLEARRKAELDAAYPELPKELWERALKTMKAQPEYVLLDALREEKVAPQLAAWQSEGGYVLKAQYVSVLYSLLEGDNDTLREFSDGAASFHINSTEFQFEAGGPEVQVYQMLVIEGDDRTYRIPPQFFSDLRFRYVESIQLVHPLNRTLGEFSVQDVNVPETISRLCQQADVDYVLNAGDLGSKSVTVRLRDRTVADCLEQVAATAGWNVSISNYNLNGDTVIGLTDSGPVGDDNYYIEGVRSLYINRDHFNLMLAVEPQVTTPLDAYRYLLLRNSRYLKANRSIVTLTPQYKEQIVPNATPEPQPK